MFWEKEILRSFSLFTSVSYFPSFYLLHGITIHHKFLFIPTLPFYPSFLLQYPNDTNERERRNKVLFFTCPLSFRLYFCIHTITNMYYKDRRYLGKELAICPTVLFLRWNPIFKTSRFRILFGTFEKVEKRKQNNFWKNRTYSFYFILCQFFVSRRGKVSYFMKKVL